MNICILTPRFPFPENGGDVLRINNIARYLKRQNHQLILVSFTNAEEPPLQQAYQLYDKIYTVPRNNLNSLFRSFLYLFTKRPIQCGYYSSWRFEKIFHKVIRDEQPSLYIAHLLRMAPYLDNDITRSRSIIEMTDALSKTYDFFRHSSKGSFLGNVYKHEYKRMLKYETYAAKRFPKCVLVSQGDIQHIQKSCPDGHLSLHTNGVQSAPQLETMYNPNKICFIGNMRTLQNRDAVLYFVQEVFPIIRKRNPHAIFYIVGAQPPELIKRLAHNKQVVVTNYVENLELVIADSCLTIAPIKIAAGIQNKVLVSMGQGIPVVLTNLIAKPIPELKHMHNCLIADEREDMAEACLTLMNNAELRNTIARNGYETVKKNYTWDEKLKGYEVLTKFDK